MAVTPLQINTNIIEMTDMKNETLSSNCETSFNLFVFLCEKEPVFSIRFLTPYFTETKDHKIKAMGERIYALLGVRGRRKLSLLTQKSSCLPCFEQWFN